MQNRGQRQMQIHNSVNHFRSCLLGIAVADALGLPMEGMSAKVVARRYPAPDRFHILGPIGFVSDDTEQSALVAQSIRVRKMISSWRQSTFATPCAAGS